MVIDAPHYKLGYSRTDNDPVIEFTLKKFYEVLDPADEYLRMKRDPEHARWIEGRREARLKEVNDTLKDVRKKLEELKKKLKEEKNAGVIEQLESKKESTEKYIREAEADIKDIEADENKR